MINYKQGIVMFLVIIVSGFVIGGFIQAAAFFGLITLIGVIVVVESIPPLKWIIKRTSKLVDVIVLVCTIIALAKLGLTVVGGLTIAGVGFSLVYAPYLREEHKVLKDQPKLMQNGMQKHWDKFGK